MSVTTQFRLTCDGPSCLASIKRSSAEAIYAAANQFGWIRLNERNMDLCSRCRADMVVETQRVVDEEARAIVADEENP